MHYLEHISWKQYFNYVTIIAVLYYITVLLLYFRSELHRYLPKQFFPIKQQISFAPTNGVKESDDLFTLASKASSTLKGYITKNKQLSKKQMQSGLQSQLKAYAVLRYTPFEQALNNLIVTMVADECSYNLDDDELSGMWIG